MGLFSFGKTKPSLVNWVNLTEENQVNDLIKESNDKPVLFFKHSIRCSISSMAKNRLEKQWDLNDQVVPVYLDLINYRSLSNHLADNFAVQHQSPQVILIKNGKSVFDASHNQISVDAIKKYL